MKTYPKFLMPILFILLLNIIILLPTKAQNDQNKSQPITQASSIMVTMAPTKQSIVDSKAMWQLDGYRVKEYKGLAMGLSVRTLGVANELLVVGKSLLGGKLEKVRVILEQSRREAYQAMLQDAINQGANAVLWAHYDDNPMGDYTEIIWYGNAVVVEPINK